MNCYPIWYIRVDWSLKEQDATISQVGDSYCHVVVFLWDELVHVSYSYTNAAPTTEAEAEENDDVEVDAGREVQHDVAD